MPSFFSFIESFFFLSLGITFILIFLMVFHFKQRIEKLERKNHDLSDLSNKIVKEVTNLHSIYLSNLSESQPQKNNFIPPKEHICENIVISTSYPISFSNEIEEVDINPKSTENTYKRILVMDSVTNEDTDEDNFDIEDFDDDDDTDTDDTDTDAVDFAIEYDNDVDNDSETNKVELENISDEIDYTPVDSNTTSAIHVLKLNAEENEMTEIHIEGVNEEEFDGNDTRNEKSTSTQPMNYNKMNVQNLKILAISKGLCSDTSKMKRAELIKLLTDEEQDVKQE